ncbi:MAG: type II secretion system protein GspD [Janthinobacterium lividum]
MSCRTWDIEHDIKHDPVTKMTRQEITQNLLKPALPTPPRPRKIITPKVPDLHPKSFETPVTLSITESAPLKDVFFQIARQAKIDLSVDPAVKGGAALQVINRPVIDVIRELCSINRLRYRLDNGILRIEPDQPYLQNYNVQFLSLKRENKNQISVTNDILNGSDQGGDGQGTGGNSGSNTVLTGETKNDFWQELEHTLSTILKNNFDGEDVKSTFSIHKQAGIISIHATQAQQRQVEQFLHMLRLSTSSQVLIEAKIVEVILDDEFQTGINWNLLKGDFILQAPFGDLIKPGRLDKKATPARDVFTLGGSGKQLTELVSLMNKFGSVRTLSSPRLSAMNNEPGFMEVATNFVYFTIDYNRDYGYNFSREHESISSKIQTVPIGLVMVVQPSINSEDGSVTLSLKLTISRVVSEKADPAVAIVSKETQNSYVPQVQGRVFDSLVHVKSGGTVVMGGLMEEFARNDQSGVPGLMDVPLVGHLAKSQEDERRVSELVIFLKVTIVDNEDDIAEKAPSVNPADTHLYEKFMIDPRPLSNNALK